MTIASTITDKPYIANGSTTQFSFPNKIFAATDLVVVLTDLLGNLYKFINFANSVTGLSYTVQNVDVDTGCSITFSAPPINGWGVDIRSLTPELQSTSVKNQGQFLPELHEEAFDRATRMIQDLLRITYTYGIHGQDVETAAWPALPLPALRKGLALLFDTNGLPTVGVPTTQTMTQALIGALLNPQSQAEINAGVTPTQLWYPYGCPRRFGNANTGNGTQDDTAAVQAAINSCDTYYGWAGDIYGVQSVVFPLGGPHLVNFNGSIIRGIATGATDYIVKFAGEGTIFLDYHVDGFNAVSNPNTNYSMQTWWYNGSAPSQYNCFFGMRHKYGIRGLVYGAPVGSTGPLTLAAGPSAGATTAVLAVAWPYPSESYNVVFSDAEIKICTFTKGSTGISWTGGLSNNVTAVTFCTSTAFAQSENQVYGFRTRGMQNPFYSNHVNGVLHLEAPIFVSLYDEWTSTGSFNWTVARALEAYYGTVVWHGGEIELAANNIGFAADLASCYITDCVIETACAVQIVGDNVQINGGTYLDTQTNTNGFKIAAGVTGSLRLSDMMFRRPDQVGSFSNQTLVDSTSPGGISFTAAPLITAVSATLTAPWKYTTGVNQITFQDGEVRGCLLTQGLTTCTWTGGLAATQSNANATMPFVTNLSDTESFEWPWRLAGANIRLVNCNAQSSARYKNHRLSITSGDPNVYVLNTNPTDSLLADLAFDRLGYLTTGWTLLNIFGGGTTMLATTGAGPAGYNAAQITLHATGNAEALSGITTSLANLQATALHVAPQDLYWLSAWVKNATAAGALVVEFFNTAGASTGRVTVADSSSIPTGSWGFVEGPVSVPAGSAYACPGVFGNVTDVQVTDLRIRRA